MAAVSVMFGSPWLLFVFIPLTILLYPVIGSRWRNILVSVASLVFYLLGDAASTLTLITIVLVNWALGYAVNGLGSQGNRAKWVAGLAIAVNLGSLIYYKYIGFLIHNINNLLSCWSMQALPVPDIAAPMGISFITFTAISYIVDILRGDAVACRNPHHTFIFLALFPKVAAGPITAFKSMAGQVLSRQWSISTACSGGARFILGLAKKVLIADTIGVAVNQIFNLPPEQLTVGTAWIGAIGYTLQIYFDFSGYTDMAVGLGRILGFNLIENFDYPYSSTSVRDFWKRWHISLTNWFREYLYIPLGGNRVGKLRTYANLMTVFLLCGLWHGANWTFIIWGAWHGIFLIIERLPGVNIQRIPLPLRYIYTMLVVILGWVAFRSSSLSYAFGFLQVMFGFSSGTAIAMPGWYLSNPVIMALALGGILSWPVVPRLLEYVRNLNAAVAAKMTPVFSTALAGFVAFVSLGLILLLTVMTLATRGFQPLIYAQF